jgi:large subunit ribosomal protein L5
MPATAPTARLKTRYLEEIRPALVGRFGYSSVMQAPRLEKVTLNMGVGQAKQDSKVLKAALDQLATIAGQQPSVRRARKSVAAFKLREGMPVGVAVTLRAERGYEFLDRLVSIAIPRIRDFRGLSPRSFDGRGNYSLGVREQIIFPEVDYDSVDEVRGLDITITTTASSDVEAFALLSALGMPFAAQGRPAGFDPAEPAGAGDAGDEQGDDDTDAAGYAPTAEQDDAAEQDDSDGPRTDASATRQPNEIAEPNEIADRDEIAEPGETAEQDDAAEQDDSDAPRTDASAAGPNEAAEQNNAVGEEDSD